MKGIIYYYSGSGNTKLACNYIKNKTKNANFDLFNIASGEIPYPEKYDMVGFATFADFALPPKLMYSFINQLNTQNNKSAFVFNTYGCLSRNTLPELSALITKKGFYVITGFSFHCPESFPPMRKLGMTFDNHPKEKDIDKLNVFIKDLDKIIEQIKNGSRVEKRKFKTDIVAKLYKPAQKSLAKKNMGMQRVNNKLCTECGICADGCPYNAISMKPKPVFNHKICAGCWYCYNHCKQKAIYTSKFKGEYQYSKPNDQMKQKLV
jgi:ferredoxin/flavodoxin